MEFFEMKFDESLLGANDYEDRTRGVGCFDATNGPEIKIEPNTLKTGLTIKRATFKQHIK